MPPKKRKRWQPSPDGATQRSAGAKLFDHLLGIYVSGKQMSAKDLAIGCHYASEAGTKGAYWSSWGLPPGRPSGRYKEHVDRRLPSLGAMMKVTIPMNVRGRAHLTKAPTDVQLVYESISEEVQLDSECQDILLNGTHDEYCVMQTRAYQNHAHVQQCVDQTGKWPLPIAVYADSVRYSPLHAGRTDSVLG
eukprot:5267741-Pyramimonas_sp.AAC.1